MFSGAEGWAMWLPRGSGSPEPPKATGDVCHQRRSNGYTRWQGISTAAPRYCGAQSVSVPTARPHSRPRIVGILSEEGDQMWFSTACGAGHELCVLPISDENLSDLSGPVLKLQAVRLEGAR